MLGLAPVYRTEDGRRIATANYKGGVIEVAAGYDIGEDAYRFHVYVTDQAGDRQKVYVGKPFADSLEAADIAGFAAGKEKLGG